MANILLAYQRAHPIDNVMAYTANATRTVTAGELRGDRVRGAATHFHVTGAKPEEKLCSQVAGLGFPVRSRQSMRTSPRAPPAS